jgi:16S rRNA processing protein RimM
MADHVAIGEVIRPHGIRGEVKIYSFSGASENFRNYKRIVLHDPAGTRSGSYEIVKSRMQGKLAILQLAGISSREDAEALQGSTVWLSKEDFPQLGPDEFYWHQLEGLAVLTETGRELGRVARLFGTRAHDVIVVTGTGREFLIPVKTEIIKEIDPGSGKLVVSPPPGLLEANEEE